MKTWTIPAAIAQQFAANDTVSACTATINCDVPVGEGFYCYIQEYGKTVQVEGVGPRTFGYYTPCGAEHEVSAHGELVGVTMTQGIACDANGNPVNTKQWIDIPEPVSCYVWFEHNENGEVLNVHCTSTPEGFQSNKS